MLEVGSGAGPFTEIALQTGALVVSVDVSAAVDANWNNNGRYPNLYYARQVYMNCLSKLLHLIKYFASVYCNIRLMLPVRLRVSRRFPRPGGELAVDSYNKEYWKDLHTPGYLSRPLTKRIPHDRLYCWVSRAVLRLSPCQAGSIPMFRLLSALVPISNYQGGLTTSSQELIRQYSILDTFRSRLYTSPLSVRAWFISGFWRQVTSK